MPERNRESNFLYSATSEFIWGPLTQIFVGTMSGYVVTSKYLVRFICHKSNMNFANPSSCLIVVS